MITQELFDFISRELNNGRSQESIKTQLLEAKWSTRDIDEAFVRIHFQPHNTNTAQNDRLLPPSILLKNSWAIYKKKWKSIIKLQIFYKLLFIPAFIIAFIIIYINFFKTLNPSSFSVLSPIFFITITVAFIIVYVLVLQSMETISLTLFLSSGEDKASVKALFKKSHPLIIPGFWLTSLYSLIVIGGLLFFIIPGIIFAYYFAFSFYILVLENIRGINALYASREIVKERFWAIAGRILIIIAFTAILSLFIRYVSTAIFLLFNPNSFNFSNIISGIKPEFSLSQSAVLLIINLLMNIGYYFIITPLALIYHILLYKNAGQLYAKSFPIPNRKSKFLILLPAFFTIIIFIGILTLTIITATNLFSPPLREKLPPYQNALPTRPSNPTFYPQPTIEILE